MSVAMEESTRFLNRLSELEPVTPGDVAAVRDRRRLLATLFDSGPAEVSRIDGVLAGIPVAEFVPPDADPATRVIYVHGGGWVAGDLDTHEGICRRLALDSELTVVSIDYRRPPESPHPAAVDDVVAVLDGSHIHSDRLILAGDSSGAHIAVEAAIRFAQASLSRRLIGLLLIQPACDPSLASDSWRTYGSGYFLTSAAMRWYWDTYLGGEQITPLWENNLAVLPPTYVFTSSLDPSADESRRFAAELAAAGVDVSVRHVDDLPHGCFTVPAAFSCATPEIRAAARWMHNLSKGSSQ